MNKLTSFRGRAVSGAFFLLCLISLAGTRPFGGGNIQETALASEGSTLEIALYLVPCMAIIFLSLHTLSKTHFLKTTYPIILVIAYCAFSLFWSFELSISVIRFFLLLLVTLSICLAVVSTGPERAISIVSISLAAVLVFDVLSVLTVANAVHRVDDIGEKLYGAWKGVHLHKNFAGPVGAVSALVFMIQYMRHRKPAHLIISILSIIFLIGTNSRTSIALLSIVIILLFLTKVSSRIFGSIYSRMLICFFLLFSVILTLANLDALVSWIADGSALTGRAHVWNALLRYIELYPWTGSGYGAFWRTGFASPILQLTDSWAIRTGQGHNGYLDIAAQIGIPGFVIAFISLVFIPVFRTIKYVDDNSLYFDLSFALIIYALLHNLFESSILSPRHPVYFFLILGILLTGWLGQSPPESPADQEHAA